ncbi:Tautomerase enzyme [Roseateles sp. YR242]|uniref:tautomerase family protein n=1 Tax=Roseateles sp. YR242 TaxID=1855305 RepID=UPI0008C01F0F|nr:tautomerase family protein [Roseateles sp. YR242]SEK88175.1 Tautomerase enzyme [Roseateles sp. YR242]
MPICFLHSHCLRSDTEVNALMSELHAAMLEVLQVPQDDHDIRYVEHRPGHFRLPGGKSEQYLLVLVQMFPGRSLEAKRALYQAIVRRFSKLGVPETEVNIVLQSPSLEDFGLRGGQAACDLDLGFKLSV